MLVVACALAGVVSGLQLSSEYSSAASKISGPVRTVGCVGCGGDAADALLRPVLGDALKGAGVASSAAPGEGEPSVVVIDARGGDAGSPDAVASYLASDVVVYSTADGGGAALGGLLAAIELDLAARAAAPGGQSLPPKAVVLGLLLGDLLGKLQGALLLGPFCGFSESYLFGISTAPVR